MSDSTNQPPSAPTSRPGCGKPIGSTGYFKVFCGSVLGPLCRSCKRLGALRRGDT